MNASAKTTGQTYPNAHGPSATLDEVVDQATSASREKELVADVGNYLLEYARERPEVAALWVFGIGFVLGWRLKPW